MPAIDVRDLLSAGVHFGHRTSRWNPKMGPYILKKRNLIHIIDLRETVRGLVTARHVTQAVAAQGRYVLFVGTKRQARLIVRAEAERCGSPCVAERWPGGLLTNSATIRKRLDRLVELEDLETSGRIQLHSKKMISSLRRQRRKIERNLGGVRQMDRLPGLLLIVDAKREHLAVREGRKLGIPVIAWMEPDSDPEGIDVVVPANDDAIGSIQIFLQIMADAVLAGREAGQGPEQPRAAQQAAAPSVQQAPATQDQREADAPASEPEQATGQPVAQRASEDSPVQQ